MEVGKEKALKSEISFLEKDAADIHSQNNDPMVIIVRCDEWKIIRFLRDQGCFIDTLY